MSGFPELPLDEPALSAEAERLLDRYRRTTRCPDCDGPTRPCDPEHDGAFYYFACANPEAGCIEGLQSLPLFNDYLEPDDYDDLYEGELPEDEWPRWKRPPRHWHKETD